MRRLRCARASSFVGLNGARLHAVLTGLLTAVFDQSRAVPDELRAAVESVLHLLEDEAGHRLIAFLGVVEVVDEDRLPVRLQNFQGVEEGRAALAAEVCEAIARVEVEVYFLLALPPPDFVVDGLLPVAEGADTAEVSEEVFPEEGHVLIVAAGGGEDGVGVAEVFLDVEVALVAVGVGTRRVGPAREGASLGEGGGVVNRARQALPGEGDAGEL